MQTILQVVHAAASRASITALQKLAVDVESFKACYFCLSRLLLFWVCLVCHYSFTPRPTYRSVPRIACICPWLCGRGKSPSEARPSARNSSRDWMPARPSVRSWIRMLGRRRQDRSPTWTCSSMQCRRSSQTPRRVGQQQRHWPLCAGLYISFYICNFIYFIKV